MHLPQQSRPIVRSIPSQPFAVRGAAEGERGVTPSEHGVQPSSILDIIANGIATLGHALGGRSYF